MPSLLAAGLKAALSRPMAAVTVAVCAAAALFAPGATAQTVVDRLDAVGAFPTARARPPEATNEPDLRARQQSLLERTLRDPTDYDATYDYVEVSKRLRDNEAAIGALERLVNYNPGLARANYELGLLYHQLGSHDAAARYLRTALASPNLEPAIRVRIDALLPDAVKQQQQSRWSGFLQTGFRYQSNATFVPSGNAVRLNGQDFLLSPRDQRQGDGSVFGLAQIAHDYDLQNQRGDVFETRLFGFGSKQLQATAFDFAYAEASFGPRFGLPELMPGASVKPYVVGQTSALRGERSPYVSSLGGGLTVRLPIAPGLTLDPGIEVRGLSVRDQDPFNTATFNGGTVVSGYLTATAKLTDDVEFEARFIGLKSEADRVGQSFVKAGASFALNLQFDPPSELIARRWKLSPFIGGAFLDFDRPNPSVDPRVARHDREFTTGVVLDAPLTPTFGLTAMIQYERFDSNLPNYRQNGFTVLGGPTARF